MAGAKGTAKQLKLHLPAWGGRRKGRRRRGEKRRLRKVPHRKRPKLSPRHPVHATWRVLPHVWNLRSRRCFVRIARCFERARDRFGFRLVHFSVQGNHIHLVVEAADERALARGMQGLGVRIAKALNRLMQRKGTVFADHYHARILRSPTQVANALAYVLLNFLHHFPGEAARFGHDPRDPFSSAWRERGRDPPVVPARTWLLSIGWRIRARDTLLSLAA
ncbi:MAG TPA: transposase [Myxococcales bacterium]|nr:transposase [Myxococcales bacterium]